VSRQWLVGLLAAAAVLAVGWDSATPTANRHATAAPTTAVKAVTPADTHEAGRAVYNFRCYFCHGYSGDAKTLASTYLDPRPRDFTSSALSLAQIETAVRDGRAGTAMKSFRGILNEAELAAVSAFVAREFVRDKAPNTRYHTKENGWPRHDRFAAAFPFARGELALDTASTGGLLGSPGTKPARGKETGRALQAGPSS